MKYSTAFILPAAGAGRRMGGSVPKPFLELAGRPVIARTLERIRQAPGVAEIVVALPSEDFEALRSRYGGLLEDLGVTAIVTGGASRQESVARALESVGGERDLVAVHDAVRPLATSALMERLFRAAARYGGALPVLPVTDTLKRIDPALDSADDGEAGRVCETVARAGLYSVQTPQVFRAPLLREAYANAASLGDEVTDDGTLAEAAGGEIVGVEGEAFNLKITTPADLRLAETLIRAGLVPRQH